MKTRLRMKENIDVREDFNEMEFFVEHENLNEKDDFDDHE